MAKRYKEEPYFPRLASKIIRENIAIDSWWEASQELELGITPEEVKKLPNNPVFKAALGLERICFMREIGRDTKRDKDWLVGMARHVAERLVEEGELKEAGEQILKVAKLEGHVGPDVTTNVFGNLSPTELNNVLDKLKAKKDQEPSENLVVSKPN